MKRMAFNIFVLIFFNSVLLGQSISKQYLIDGFLNPPTEAKPKGYWCLVNGNYDLTQMTEELKQYKEKGVGTLDIWDVAGWVDENNVIPAGPAFMSDESVQAIAHAIREAGKIGIDIGLTISSSWNAGGDWIKPEDGVMGIFESTIITDGAQNLRLKIDFPIIPEKFGNIDMLLKKRTDGLPTFYKEIAVLAYQYNDDSLISRTLDISDNFEEGILECNLPEGSWQITRYVCTGTGQPLMRPSPNSNGLMIDHFSAEATKKHLNFFFEKLESELGDLSKTALKYLYTDSYEANSAVWTLRMEDEFEDRVGYEIYSYLPALYGFTIVNEETTNRFLFDYKKVLSDLIIENHYVLGKRLCEEKGLEFIAEAGGPGPPIHNCPFESISSLGKLSAPRGEFWFDPMWSEERINDLQIIKGPASAAHLYGHKRVEAEAFTGTQIWQFGPGDLKSAADRALCEGLTSFVYHTSPHIPKEAGRPGWVYNFGTIINTTRAWWPLSEGFHKYIARSCFLLQQGNFVADVLYYYGDQAPNFVKAKRYDPSLGFGYDYDVTNSDIILNHLDVKDGYFILPHGQKYKLLVLPDNEEINLNVLLKLSQLIKKGGIVVGPKPERSHSLRNYKMNDNKVLELADKLWPKNNMSKNYGSGIVYNNNKLLKDILLDLKIQPDVRVNRESPEKSLDFIHRQTETMDIYFFRNKENKPNMFLLGLRTNNSAPELWNPDEGTITKINVFTQKNGSTEIPLFLNNYGSAFIIFHKGKPSIHISKIYKETENIFPNESNKRPILFSDNQILFNENGEYSITYSNNEVQKYNVSKCSSKVLEGEWELRFPHGWGTPPRIKLNKLISWTEHKNEGIKHFSGVAIYYHTFEYYSKITNKVTLDLGNVSKVAKVYLNGHDLGIKWFAPYEFDITKVLKEGKNKLIIEIANVMSNQMVGDSKRSAEHKRTHSNITKAPNAWMTPYSDYSLIESGLMGPVSIRTHELLNLR